MITEAKLTMSDGFGLSYRRWSSRYDARKVVLGLHGIGGHSGHFALMGERLAEGYGTQVYAIDRRGFGNSLEPGLQRGNVSSFRRYLQDIDDAVELIRTNHPEKKFYIFGKSLGCVHALRYAAYHSEKVDGLVLAAPPIKNKARIPPSLIVRALFLVIFSPNSIIDGVKSQSIDERKSDEVRTSLEDPLGAHGKFSARYLYGVSSFVRSSLVNAKKVRTPTLLLQGDSDNVVVPGGAQTLLETLSTNDKVMKTFPGADHGFYDSLPPRLNSKYDSAQKELVVTAVGDWLNTH